MELEFKNPNELTLVTAALLKQHPEWITALKPYHSVSADQGVDPNFVNQVRETGFIHTPLFTKHIVDADNDLDMVVVVAGRKRWLAAKQLGLREVPTIERDEDTTGTSVVVEATENLARRELSVIERAEAYRKLFVEGFTQEQVGKLTGMTGAAISQALCVAEMPPFVLKMIEKGTLSMTAAYNLKSFGKKAAKASGRQYIYDEEAQKNMKLALEELSEEARTAGKDGKIKSARTAKDSKTRHADSFSRRNWEALYASGDTPDDYKALIGVFLGKLSAKQAKDLAGDGMLDWLVKIEPQPKPKKVKEPKIKSAGTKTAKPSDMSDDDLSSLFE